MADSDKYKSNPVPKGPSPSPYQKKGSTDDKMYGNGKSMSERMQNYATGGAKKLMEKVAGGGAKGR